MTLSMTLTLTMETISSGISLVSLAVATFIALILFLNQRAESDARIFAAIMAVYASGFLLRYAYATGLTLSLYLPFAILPLAFTAGPLVYAYCRACLFRDDPSEQRRPTVWFRYSLVPVAMLIVYSFVFYYWSEFRDLKQVTAQAGPVGIFSRFWMIAFSLYSLVFLYRARNLIRRYQRSYADNYSSADESRLEWLRLFLAFNAAVCLVYPGLVIFSLFTGAVFPVTPLEGLIALGLVYLILYYLIRKPRLFALIAEPGERSETAPKYSRQNLAPEKRKSYLAAIQNHMASVRPYLNDRLTLADLSDQVQIPAHHVSMVINIELGQSFFHFVNSYRVAEAGALLSDPTLGEHTLLNIAFRSGFQSKAAFNKIFKQATGATPGAFRKKALAATPFRA